MATPEARLFRWQCVNVSLMLAGYAGYYLCRSNLPVALPLIIAELSAKGVPADAARVSFGSMASAGVLVYAFGKLAAGGVADFLGGRRNFLLGMAGSILFTLLFALSGAMPLFTLAWIGDRLVQSGGWAGLVKISSKWFSYSTYGTVMGIISLSFLFGDAASRQFLGVLIGRGMGWRGVFMVAAATLAAILAANVLLLRESPRDVGLREPPVRPDNLFDAEGNTSRPASIGVLLRAFARSGSFWLVCLLSAGMTLMRETFSFWTPLYFTQGLGLTAASAAQWSSLFPLFGGLSVLVAGVWSDRLGRPGRAAIIFYGMVLAGAALLLLAHAKGAGPAIALVALVGFLVIAPYSYLAGAIALDFGGRQGSATASGLIDGFGYFGGVLAGNSMAHVSLTWGWSGAFTVLAVVAFLSGVAAAAYLFVQRPAPVVAAQAGVGG